MICAVIDIMTGQQVNTIVANSSDQAPDGCRLVEIPDGYRWDGSAVVPVEAIDGD